MWPPPSFVRGASTNRPCVAGQENVVDHNTFSNTAQNQQHDPNYLNFTTLFGQVQSQTSSFAWDSMQPSAMPATHSANNTSQGQYESFPASGNNPAPPLPTGSILDGLPPPPKGSLPPPKRRSNDWERNRVQIRKYYLDEDKTLEETMQLMANEHGFHERSVSFWRTVSLDRDQTLESTHKF